jgi:hypothetical protein
VSLLFGEDDDSSFAFAEEDFSLFDESDAALLEEALAFTDEDTASFAFGEDTEDHGGPHEEDSAAFAFGDEGDAAFEEEVAFALDENLEDPAAALFDDGESGEAAAAVAEDVTAFNGDDVAAAAVAEDDAAAAVAEDVSFNTEGDVAAAAFADDGLDNFATFDDQVAAFDDGQDFAFADEQEFAFADEQEFAFADDQEFAFADEQVAFEDDSGAAFAGTTDPTTLSQSSTTTLPTWGIALIVLGAFIAIACILVVIQLFIYFRSA